MSIPDITVGRGSNLESSADTENAVVGFLGRKTLDGDLNGLGLLGNQVIGPLSWSALLPFTLEAKV